MRQNGTTISLLLDCVSYEILCETRIKPSFFGNCLIFLSSAVGAQCLGSQFAGVAPQASRGAWPRGTIRAKGRRLNAASVRTTSARARRRRVKFFAQLSRKKAGRVWDSVPRSWWRQQAQERLKMSRWDIFRWRTLAGGPPCRQGRQRFPHRAPLSPRPKRVPPFGISDGGGTRMCAGR